MNTNDNTPSIFRDIDVEHAEMRTLLANVHRVLTDRTQTGPEVVATLSAFFEFLHAHFQHEDEGGFFEQITEQSPRLSDRADEVRREHGTLLDDFQAFKSWAAANEVNDAWWDHINSEFHRISKDLMHHEHREQDLLQESYSEDIGTGD